MLHARKDYNRRVQDNENVIPDDEPVFLLRAKDVCTIPTLYSYIKHLRKAKVRGEGNINTEIGTLRHIERMLLWQRESEIAQPGSPMEELE